MLFLTEIIKILFKFAIENRFNTLNTIYKNKKKNS